MVVVSWGPPQIPNGIILEYSVELERYEDGSEVDRQDVDGNTFVVEFDDSQNIGKFNVTIVILIQKTCIAWTEATICFAMSASTEMLPAQKYQHSCTCTYVGGYTWV